MLNEKQISYRLGRHPGQQGPRPLLSNQDRVEKWTTGRNNKIITPPSTSIQLRKKLRIATWNIRSMLQIGKIQILEHEMDRMRVDIWGLEDDRWDGQEHFYTADGHTIIYSGNIKRGLHSVAIWIHKRISEVIVGYEPINQRVMVVRLNARSRVSQWLKCIYQNQPPKKKLYKYFMKIWNEPSKTCPKVVSWYWWETLMQTSQTKYNRTHRRYIWTRRCKRYGRSSLRVLWITRIGIAQHMVQKAPKTIIHMGIAWCSQ